MDVLAVLLLFAPLVLVLWLANHADRERESGRSESARVLSWIAYGLLLLLYLSLGAIGLLFVVVGLLSQGPLGAQLESFYAAGGFAVFWGLSAFLFGILGAMFSGGRRGYA